MPVIIQMDGLTVNVIKICALVFRELLSMMHQSSKSLCPSGRGAPDDSKTPPTCEVWMILAGDGDFVKKTSRKYNFPLVKNSLRHYFYFLPVRVSNILMF